MTAQVKALAAPALPEAVNGVLHVGKLKEHATAVIQPYVNSAAGDKVTLHVKTGTGSSFEDTTILTAGGGGLDVLFYIPKSFFESEPLPTGTANLHYVVIRVAGTPDTSKDLEVKLER